MLEPDVGDLDLARVEAARRHRQADFLALEGDRRCCLDANRGDLACRRIHAGGHVNRHHRHAGAADRLDRPCRFLARLAVEAGAEDRVDDDVPRRQLGSHLGNLRRELRGRDPAIAAVRALAADRDDARAGIVARHHRCNGGARPFHHRLDVVPFLRRLHLFSRVERLEFTHRLRQPPSPARASATSRGRSRPQRALPPKPASARRG